MEELIMETKNGVRTLILNRPKQMNAITDELSTQVEQALAEASADDDVRVVVITGSGKAFCAGLDLSKAPGSFTTRHKQLDELGWVGRQALGIVHCDKPVIAAINGVAAGAGLSLALACDLCFMTQGARVTTGYIRRGLNPDAGMSYFLPRLVGKAKATELILTGRDIPSDEAEQIGLVCNVFPDESFMDQVRDAAAGLASGPPIALTLSKRLLTASPDADLTTILKQEYAFIKQCFGTEDVQEGIQAFLEKRKPNFVGK
ncbi:enoyl-CoA hydratase-related protein [Lentibacillus sp. N15]|uniref:enoyl-CoA hydratase/isomerase family protein n=1 Tax=Lentibacillus songyuanensis TaxID=3136161 RepID=UPI0031BA5BC6